MRVMLGGSIQRAGNDDGDGEEECRDEDSGGDVSVFELFVEVDVGREVIDDAIA